MAVHKRIRSKGIHKKTRRLADSQADREGEGDEPEKSRIHQQEKLARTHVPKKHKTRKIRNRKKKGTNK